MWPQAGSAGREERSRVLGDARLREFRCENEDAQWWKRQRGGMRLPMRLDFGHRDPAEIPDVAAAVDLGVGVEDFAQARAGRDSDPVILARDRRKITDAHDEIVGPLAASQIC